MRRRVGARPRRGRARRRATPARLERGETERAGEALHADEESNHNALKGRSRPRFLRRRGGSQGRRCERAHRKARTTRSSLSAPRPSGSSSAGACAQLATSHPAFRGPSGARAAGSRISTRSSANEFMVGIFFLVSVAPVVSQPRLSLRNLSAGFALPPPRRVAGPPTVRPPHNGSIPLFLKLHKVGPRARPPAPSRRSPAGSDGAPRAGRLGDRAVLAVFPVAGGARRPSCRVQLRVRADRRGAEPVSYTHLTLPTILLV